jgi:hypothetical protein
MCEVAAVLTAGGYIGLYFSFQNRVYLFYTAADAWAILGLVFSGGLLAAGFLHVLSFLTRGRSDWVLGPWMYFWWVLALFHSSSFFREQMEDWMPWLPGAAYYLLIWGIGGIWTAIGYLVPVMHRAALKSTRLLLVLWPLLLLVPVYLLSFRPWGPQYERRISPGRNEDGTGAPILIIIPDAVGYDEVFDEKGQVQDLFPIFKEFAETASVFHQARSAGESTHLSLPGLVLQQEVGEPMFPRGDVLWNKMEDGIEQSAPATAFRRALPRRIRERGGRAVMYGFYVPWISWMPGMWDEVFSLSFSYGGGDSRMMYHLMAYWGLYSKSPIGALVKLRWREELSRRHYRRLLTFDLLERTRAYLMDSFSPGDLLVVHLPIPHLPAVFGADGGLPRQKEDLSYAAYRDQLIYTDQAVGGILETLKASSLWEESWVVLTSDHGMHGKYKERPEEIRHVPLLIKAPGQTGRRDIWEEFRFPELGDWLELPLPES